MWGNQQEQQEFAEIWPLWHGSPDERDRRSAVKRLTTLAEAGYAPAQSALGMAYFDGQGVRRDHKTAFDWFMRSAEQGYPGAQGMVGNYYMSATTAKNVCEYSPEQAAKWHKQAAEAGNSGAQYNLAFSYSTGRGVSQSFLQTYLWASLAVHCSPIRNRPAEALQNQAASELSADERKQADEQIVILQARLPHAWSEPMLYWKHLAEI